MNCCSRPYTDRRPFCQDDWPPKSWSWKPTVISSTFDPTSGVNPAILSCKAMFICSSKERIVQHTARVSTATQAAADGVGRCILRLSREICQKYAENCWALGLGGFPAPMFFSSWTLIGHFYIPLFWCTELDPWLEFLSNTNWLLADIYK